MLGRLIPRGANSKSVYEIPIFSKAGNCLTDDGRIVLLAIFVGLAIPAKIMEFGFVNGTSHKIEIGSMTPTGSGYYVRYDAGTVYVISKSGIDALLNLLTAPPYPATETPSPTTESKSTQLP